MKLHYRKDEMIAFCTLPGGAFWMLLALVAVDQPLQRPLLNKRL